MNLGEGSLWPQAGSTMPLQQPTVRDVERLYFGRFCAVPCARQLLADGRPVRLGGRAFDLLVLLLNARGTVVSKDEIVNCVWPSISVEESNLRFQIAALRRVLGKDRDLIKTVSGRGYLLAAEVDHEPSETDVASEQALGRAPTGNTCEVGSASWHWPPESPSSGQCEGRSRIAIIDDDEDVRESLDGLLRSAGLRAELFSSVQEFLDRASGSPPKCLVLDVWLPGQSGLDFHAELVKADMKLPVIFISGHADIPMSVEAMKAGAVDFLTKPVHHVALLDAIRRAIRVAPPALS